MTAEIFTQSRLQDFSECAYRYLLRYVKKVENPTLLSEPIDEYEAAVERGSAFHRLAEQYFSGVPQEALLTRVTDPQIRAWWARLMSEAFDDLPARRIPEITLVAPLGDDQLAAKIDLLAIEPGRVVIVDWKTSHKPKASSLEARIQTKVYRWVVSQAVERAFGTTVTPEQIQMRYWFAGDSSPQVSISYSHLQQQTDERDLRQLISQIKQERDFERTTDQNRCRYCSYRSINWPLLTPGMVMLEEEAGAVTELEAVSTEL